MHSDTQPINIYLQNTEAQISDFKERYNRLKNAALISAENKEDYDDLNLSAHVQAERDTNLNDKIAQILEDEKAVELIVIDSAKLNQYFEENKQKYQDMGIDSPGQLIHRLHTKVAPCYYNPNNVVSFVDNNGKSQSGVLGVDHDGALAKAYQVAGYLSREEIAIAQECLVFMRKAIAVNDTGRYNYGKNTLEYEMYGREKTLVDFAGIRLEHGAPQREEYVTNGILNRAKYKETYKKSVKAALMAIAMKAHSTGQHAHFRECGRGDGWWASRWKSEIGQILAEIYQEIYEESTFIRQHVTTVFPYEAYGNNFVLGAPAALCESEEDTKIGRLTANCLGNMNKSSGHYYKEVDISPTFSDKQALLDTLNPQENELYFEGVAGDGGAMFGNEFWKGSLGASGDPAAACGGYMAARIAAEKSNTPWPITYSEVLELNAILGDDVTVDIVQNGDLRCGFSGGQEYDVTAQNADALCHIMSLFNVENPEEFLRAMNSADNINYTLKKTNFEASITTTNLTDFYGTAILADLLRKKCYGLSSVSLQDTTLTCAFSSRRNVEIELNEQIPANLLSTLKESGDGAIQCEHLFRTYSKDAVAIVDTELTKMLGFNTISTNFATLTEAHGQGFILRAGDDNGMTFEKQSYNIVIPYASDSEVNTVEAEQAPTKRLPTNLQERLNEYSNVLEVLDWLGVEPFSEVDNKQPNHSITLGDQAVPLNDENLSTLFDFLNKKGNGGLKQECQEAYKKHQKGMAKFAYFAFAILGVIPALIWWATRKSRLAKIESDSNALIATNEDLPRIAKYKEGVLRDLAERFKGQDETSGAQAHSDNEGRQTDSLLARFCNFLSAGRDPKPKIHSPGQSN